MSYFQLYESILLYLSNKIQTFLINSDLTNITIFTNQFHMEIVSLIKIISVKPFRAVFSIVTAGILFLCLSLSCKDNTKSLGISPCEANPGNCKSILEAKDFFVFKVGSYWVYEEETSHQRDSLYVTNYTNDNEGYYFYIKIKSSLTNYEYTYWPEYHGTGNQGCSQTNPVSEKCLYVYRAKGKFQDNLGESHAFFVNYRVGDYTTSGGSINYCQNNKVRIGGIYEDFTIPMGSFTDVVRIDQDCEYAEGKQPTRFYYSKNNFIIRKELIDSNQVWNLVNYHIVQ